MTNIDQLRDQLREYDWLYRLGSPAISDTEYDKLFNELKRLEAESGEPPADSPTQLVGSNLFSPELKQGEVAHSIPMLSIDNVYSTGELLDFGNKVERILKDRSGEPCKWVVELKIDGVSLSLIYENGKLVRGVTRGNGLIGNDITYNLDMVVDIPKQLHPPSSAVCRLPSVVSSLPSLLEVRGEVYMLNSDLTILNEQQIADGEDVYKNARNVTSGTISMKNPDEEKGKKRQKILDERKRRKLHFFAHSIGSEEGITAQTHWDFLQELKSCGIPLAPHTKRFDTFADAVNYCESLYGEEDNFLSELDFEIDGLVLKADSFAIRKALGATGHHPRWMTAYKVEKYEAETKLLNIVVQVGKNGTITPVAELEPVDIAGTTVSRASLHNAEEIERKDIRIGDTVVVEKAGKIIPHVVRVVSHSKDDSRKFVFPAQCPACNSPLSKDADTVYIRCNNPQCTARFKEKLRYFANRNAMDIGGLGGYIAEKIVETGLVRTLPDLYRLKDRKAELTKIERLGEKYAARLFDSIEASKNKELRFFINALSIPNVGTSTARDLANYFGTFEKLRKAAETELADIENIGEITARSIVEFFRSEKEMLDELLTFFNQPEAPDLSQKYEPAVITADKTGALAGLTIVVTGALVNFKRHEIEDVIAKHGGKASSSVSAKTSFVLVGSDPGSKLAKAQKLGIRIVYENEFREMIEDG
ncbi:MAG: NAD-dependent DNA ligase LigA [Planctomycetaceae bacterium]|nr:NAD-dependent DNA ligase LigA [Planctomycetaceae bacterium]